MSATRRPPSYTAQELEEETGFDRRTIAYYVQEGLLPRVGRRGPRTRYPRLVRDRLLFIRRVREAEEAGEVSAVSLSDMRTVFERVPPALIAKVADGAIAVTPELVERASTGFRLPAMRRAMLEERVMGRVSERSAPPARARVPSTSTEPGVVYAPPPASGDMFRAEDASEADEWEEEETDPADTMGELLERTRNRDMHSPTALDTWTRIEVTPGIELSVRGLTDADAGLVERVRRAMARLMGIR